MFVRIVAIVPLIESRSSVVAAVKAAIDKDISSIVFANAWLGI